MARRKKDAAQPSASPAAPDRLRPWLAGAVCALFVVRPLYASESAAAEGAGIPVVMLWLVLAVVWLLGVIGRREFPLRFTWTDAAVLLFIVLHTLSAVWGAAQGSARPAVNLLWEWIGLGVGFFLARQLLVTPQENRAAAAAMLALAVAVSAHGYYQSFYELPKTRAAYRAEPERLLREAGLPFGADLQQRKVFEDRLNSPEPLAAFELTNSLAGFLAPWLVVAAGIAAFGSGPVPLSRGQRAALAAVALVLGGCLVLTMSRSGYIAAAFGLAVLGLWAGRKVWRHWKLLAVAAVVLAGFVAVAVATREVDASIFTQAARSLGYRVQYWRSTGQMIADHPLLGVGPGNFQVEYARYKLPEAAEEIADPHNFLLEVWATAGAPSLLALLAVLGSFAWLVFRALRRESGNAASTEPRSSPCAWIGVAAGFLLAILLGPLVPVAPDPLLLLGGVVLAGGTLALLRPWIDRGRLPPLLPAAGIAVLLVNLLAAGGIGFPAIAGTLWLLLAIGLNGMGSEEPPPGERATVQDSSGSTRRTLSWGKGVALLGLVLTLAIGCCLTAYWPVLHCRQAIEKARRNPAAAEAHLLQAAQADPLSAEPWDHLASLAFLRWRERPGSGVLQSFEEYSRGFLSRVSRSHSAWSITGNRYMGVFKQTGRKEALDEAVVHLQKAVELYPNSAVREADLALALRLAGDSEGFAQHAEAALRLDEATPHAAKKLPAELRKELRRNVSER